MKTPTYVLPLAGLLAVFTFPARAPAQVWSEPEWIRTDSIRMEGDYDPCISADNRLLFVSAFNYPWGCHADDIIVARNAGNGVWDSIGVVPKACNMDSDMGPSISTYGDTLYFVHQYLPGGYGGWDIWYTILTDTGWSDPVNLGPPINTPASETTPFISRDGMWMYYTSDGPDGYAEEDPWRSHREPGGLWGPPESLGYIQTPNTIERGVSVTADNLTLYYSTSVNRTDIMVSHWDSIAQVWTPGVNLGPPINTPYPMRDERPYISSCGDTLYFMSTRFDTLQGNLPRVYYSHRIDTTGVSGSLPSSVRLFTAFPNPWNSQTTIRLMLTDNADCVTIVVYDILGRTVNTPMECTPINAGEHDFVWNGKDKFGADVSSGVYFVVLKTDDLHAVIKTVLLK